MSSKTLRAVFGALVGLALVYAVVLLAGAREEPLPEGGEELEVALGSVVASQVTSVRLVGPLDSVELSRSGERWSVNGLPADTLAVTRLLDALEGGAVENLVASNPGNHERLGVAGDQALRLTVGTGGPGVELVVGNASPDGNSSYVRLPNADEVYLVRSALRTAASRSVEQWRDRTVVRADTAAIARLVVERDGMRTELVRGDSTWTANGAPAQALPVRDLLGGIASLIGVGFAPDSVSVDPVERRLIGITAEGDTIVHIEIGASHEPGNLPARAPGVIGVVEISDFQGDRITPTRETLTGG